MFLEQFLDPRIIDKPDNHPKLLMIDKTKISNLGLFQLLSAALHTTI